MLTFDEATHTYCDDGQVLPSVTHILRFMAYDVAEFAKPWLRDAAADKGTRIHDNCADLDFGIEPDSIDFDCIGYVNAYRSFLRDYRPTWCGIEVPAGSKDIGYAGTPDRYGYIDGDFSIVDIKSGTRLNIPQVSAQLSAYESLIGEPAKHYSLHLKSDGTYSFVQRKDELDLFKACWKLHKALGGKTA